MVDLVDLVCCGSSVLANLVDPVLCIQCIVNQVDLVCCGSNGSRVFVSRGPSVWWI